MKRRPSGTPGVPTSFLCPQELHVRMRSICDSTEQSARQFMTRALEREIEAITKTANTRRPQFRKRDMAAEAA
jgi:hypothetical protein